MLKKRISMVKSPPHQWRMRILSVLLFISMVGILSMDSYRLKPKQDHENNNLIPAINKTLEKNTTQYQTNQTTQLTFKFNYSSPENRHKLGLRWVSAVMEPNFTANLMDRWSAPGGEPCRDAKTVDIEIPGLDGKDFLELSAGEIHELGFQAIDEKGNHVCSSGDYFETDLSGDKWKSRPPVKDFGNGSYSVSLQVHPDFTGVYNLTVNLLFRHLEGLKYSPPRFVINKELRRFPIKFYKDASKSRLPGLRLCEQSDFSKDVWSGRWTRHGQNNRCPISNDGRYRCLPPDFPCQTPWCNGSLGLLESNGWVYSTHCSFKLFESKPAWDCLKDRWIFFWGDSNHVDTIRNILNFVLDLRIASVPRRFDMKFTNPKNRSQSVRITSIFNGHWNETQNYLGLDSLQNEGFRNLVKRYFSEKKSVPDTIILNSGLHDGVYFKNVRGFINGAEYAASFWKRVLHSVRRRGLLAPKVIYRNTVATGGYARELSYNPSKMEVYNAILLEKLKDVGIVSSVIDNFDMTFPWHYDNRCNDGVHYGRAPVKKDGEMARSGISIFWT